MCVGIHNMISIHYSDPVVLDERFWHIPCISTLCVQWMSTTDYIKTFNVYGGFYCPTFPLIFPSSMDSADGLTHVPITIALYLYSIFFYGIVVLYLKIVQYSSTSITVFSIIDTLIALLFITPTPLSKNLSLVFFHCQELSSSSLALGCWT